MSPPTSPPEIPRGDLPAVAKAVLASELAPDERVFFHAQPIRHANGRGVWLIMGLGVVFCGAGAAPLVETMAKLREAGPTVAGVALLGLALFFVAFSLVLLAWPLLSYRRMRNTHVVISDRRVLELVHRREGRPPRVKSWPLSACTDVSVARRRGASATLVLRERVRERASDGQTIYEWEALHGLPRADEAFAVIQRLRGG